MYHVWSYAPAGCVLLSASLEMTWRSTPPCRLSDDGSFFSHCILLSSRVLTPLRVRPTPSSPVHLHVYDSEPYAMMISSFLQSPSDRAPSPYTCTCDLLSCIFLFKSTISSMPYKNLVVLGPVKYGRFISPIRPMPRPAPFTDSTRQRLTDDESATRWTIKMPNGLATS